MNQPRRHRIDEAQKEIVRLVKQVPGWSWKPLRDHADGLLRGKWWPQGIHLLVEIKTDKGKLRPGQALLEENRETVIVRSFEDVQNVMDVVARRLDSKNYRDNQSYIPESP